MAKKEADKRYPNQIDIEDVKDSVTVRIPSGFYTHFIPVENGWLAFGSAGAVTHITDPTHHLFRDYKDE